MPRVHLASGSAVGFGAEVAAPVVTELVSQISDPSLVAAADAFVVVVKCFVVVLVVLQIDLDLAVVLDPVCVKVAGSLEPVYYDLGFENFGRGSCGCSAGCSVCVGVLVGEPRSAVTAANSEQFLHQREPLDLAQAQKPRALGRFAWNLD